MPGCIMPLKAVHPSCPLFIFDTKILDLLENKADRRVEFIQNTLTEIHGQLCQFHSTLLVRHGPPPEVFRRLLDEYEVKAVYANTDYEPYATERDGEISQLLNDHHVPFHRHKDQVIFE